MISLEKVLIIGGICFLIGEICGIFVAALCSANRRFEGENNE